MSFRGDFIAVFLGTAMVVAAFLVNAKRPAVERFQPTASLVRASGKCAECHRQETSAIVHEFEMSKHSEKGINCLDCHQPAPGQDKMDHRGFVINDRVTAANCSSCHQTQYDQYLRSRHAAPAWASVAGRKDFSAEQIAFSEKFHPRGVDRDPHPVGLMKGQVATGVGCLKCHEVGKPNKDGSIGSCTACHARHVASVELARLPETCGQCHMGPDHSQIEIYHESKHGVLFNAQRSRMNLAADPPKHLTTADMPVPTCSTCHMSGLEGQKFTHDVRYSRNRSGQSSEQRNSFSVTWKGKCLPRPVVLTSMNRSDSSFSSNDRMSDPTPSPQVTAIHSTFAARSSSPCRSPDATANWSTLLSHLGHPISVRGLSKPTGWGRRPAAFLDCKIAQGT
jgi:Seven times multi-haem cytochrome CxxCH